VSLCHYHPRNSGLSLFSKIPGVSSLSKLAVVLPVYKFQTTRPCPHLYEYSSQLQTLFFKFNFIIVMSLHPHLSSDLFASDFPAKFLYANTSALTRAMKVSTAIYPVTGFCESKCSKIHTLLKSVIAFLSVRFWSKSPQDTCE
jgi:hypothetical protein